MVSVVTLSGPKDYLNEKQQQYTVSCDERSVPTRISLVVPQGSVLGPVLLIIIFMTFNFFQNPKLLFADEVTLYFT